MALNRRHIQANSNWSPHNFWVKYYKDTSHGFHTSVTKSSSLEFKTLWYIQKFLTYFINARGKSHKAIIFDDLFLLHCMVNNEQIELGKVLQRTLWLLSDSASGNICIGSLITKLAYHFRINTSNLNTIPSNLLDSIFIKNSKQFKKMEG